MSPGRFFYVRPGRCRCIGVIRTRTIAVAALISTILAGCAVGGSANDADDGTGGPRRADAMFRADATNVASCSTTDDRCLGQAYGNRAFKKGASVALAELQKQVDARVLHNRCHMIAHQIGRAALRRENGSLGTAISVGSPLCSSGYYHGVVIAALAGRSKASVRKQVRSICHDRAFKRSPYILNQCHHGLGHALVVYSGRAREPALHLCDEVDQAKNAAVCHGGVFMEVLGESGQLMPASWKLADAEQFCVDLAERYRHGCYGQIGIAINNLAPNEWQQYSQICERAGSMIDTCFGAMGGLVGSVGLSPFEVAAACGTAGVHEGTCAFGAARSLLVEDRSWSLARQFCRAVTDLARVGCAAAMGAFFSEIGMADGERKRLCPQLMERQHVSGCMGTGRPVAVVQATN